VVVPVLKPSSNPSDNDGRILALFLITTSAYPFFSTEVIMSILLLSSGRHVITPVQDPIEYDIISA
jgi:hypothetical protein